MRKILQTLFLLFISLHLAAQSDTTALLNALFSKEFKADEPGGAVLVVRNGKC